MKIEKTKIDDLEQILNLQIICFQSEKYIPSLEYIYENILYDYHKGIILKAILEDNSIIGSIRGYIEDDTLYIGKLIVMPEYHSQGIGTKLLSYLKSLFPNYYYEPFSNDINNLYDQETYEEYNKEEISNDYKLKYLHKGN